MPNQDGTGPQGQGARTGRGQGNCAGQGGTGRGRGLGRGRGAGRGFGRERGEGNSQENSLVKSLQAVIAKLTERLDKTSTQ